MADVINNTKDVYTLTLMRVKNEHLGEDGLTGCEVTGRYFVKLQVLRSKINSPRSVSSKTSKSCLSVF